MISKERRHALRITQGPRSRASLAALPCHSSYQTTHSSLGATYNFQLCDSVPDLSGTNGFDLSSSNGGVGGGGIAGVGGTGAFSESNSMSMLTNHSLSTSSAPRKIPSKNGAFHANNTAAANNNNNNFLMNGYGTPLRMQNHQITKSVPAPATAPADYDNDDNVVQLRRRNAFMTNASHENATSDKQNDWMYRRPTAPNDVRHSCKQIVIDSISV